MYHLNSSLSVNLQNLVFGHYGPQMKPLIPVHFPKAKPDSRLNAIEHLPESARSAFPTILESKGIKVTFNDNAEPEEELFRAIALKCKSWLCSECRIVKGLETQEAFSRQG